MAPSGFDRSRGYVEMVDGIIDEAFHLAFSHHCKVYVLVENKDGIQTFSSYESRLWPPPDQTLFVSIIERNSKIHFEQKVFQNTMKVNFGG
ncbi:hypothetical protein BJX66DRAFT_115056 [Aspergillus keveii]|uniref:Uncharacterized protein n=1 Tax=Aspergillus keveii TaxID=714993 RepID=A0ABR4FKN2_9EURO